MILILRKDKYILRRIGLYSGIWGEAELFLGIWGAEANTFMETMKIFAGRRVDQCNNFRDQGSIDPSGGSHCLQYWLPIEEISR